MSVLSGLRGNHHPSFAKTPLSKAANALIEILDDVDHYPALYLNREILQNALFRYEHRWIPLLASVPAAKRLSLVPPLDVEWVWFCHMLCPVRYITDSAAMWNAVRSKEQEVIIDHKLVTGAERHEGKRKAALIWLQLYPDESFDILQILKDSPIRVTSFKIQRKEVKKRKLPESRISCDIFAVAERQMVFHYQVAIMPQYRDQSFLRHAVKRYKHMFLKLQKCFPGEVWVPTYDIDLIRHAHMMHPRWYKASTEKLRGSVLPHDDVLNIQRPDSKLDMRWDATVKIWTQMIRKEPIIREGGMWRGNVEAEERIERPRIRRFIEIVEDKAFSTVEKYSGASQENSMSNGRRFSVIYDGDANWKNAQLGWVHMTALRGANREGRVSTEGRENKVERITFLKYTDQPNLLKCRTLHFLMYNNRDEPYNFGTILEVFGAGAFQSIPLATAHYVLPHTLRKLEFATSRVCAKRPYENVLLLRVGGEDFGLLAGTWTGFHGSGKGIEALEGTTQSPGQLELRLWLLGNRTTEQWMILRRKGGTKEPGQYSFELPILEDSRVPTSAPVEFDFTNATVFTRHRKHVIPAYLISMAAAALHVTLQPRFASKEFLCLRSTANMYPEWGVRQNPYDMLRGAGGEVKVKGNRGLWTMLLQTEQSLKGASGISLSQSFSGSAY